MKSSKSPQKNKPFFQALIDELSSVQLTVLLLALIIPATILGTLIPQGRPWQEYVEQFGWNFARILYFLWLTDIFKSFWFLFLLVALGVNVLACTLKSIIERKRTWGFVIVHLSLIFLIAGGFLSAAGRIRGFVKIKEGETTEHFEVGKRKLALGFALRLKDFELVRYANSGEKLMIKAPDQEKVREYAFRNNIWTQIIGTPYQFRVEQFIPDFRMNHETGEVMSASDQPRNPAIYVHIQGEEKDFGQWVFAIYPDSHHPKSPFRLNYRWEPFVPKDFISQLEVIKDGRVVLEKKIKVNHPLRYRGLSIYQSSYDPEDETWSGFEVVKDPGTWVVFTGMMGLMLGLAHNIYWRPLMGKGNGNGRNGDH